MQKGKRKFPFFFARCLYGWWASPLWGRAIQGSGRYATANAPLLSLSRRKTTYSFSEFHFLRFKVHFKPSFSESHCILPGFTFSFLPKQASDPIRLLKTVILIRNPSGKIRRKVFPSGKTFPAIGNLYEHIASNIHCMVGRIT